MKKYFESVNKKVLMINVLVFAFVLTTSVAYAAMTLSTDTISGSGALNLNPTGQPVTVNGDLNTTGLLTVGDGTTLPSLLQGYTGAKKLLINYSNDTHEEVAVGIQNYSDFGLYVGEQRPASSAYAYGFGNGVDIYAGADGQGLRAYEGFLGTGGFNNVVGWDFYAQAPQGSFTTLGAFYSEDLAGTATNPYYSWFDSRGVGRCKEDNTFDSVGQSICVVYNPQFQNTAGAANYERIVYGEWNGNVAEIGAQAGGTGTLRALKLIGASVSSVGGFTAPTFSTATNCADSAGAAACGSAAAGAFVIDAGSTSVVVSTTAVTANSEIKVQFDSSLGTRLGITCNTAPATVAFPSVTARTAGTSFTVSVTGSVAVNPACFSYSIVN